MVNRNIKKMLLFVSLCVLLLGIVCAQSPESEDSLMQTDTITDHNSDDMETVSVEGDNHVNNKEITKEVKTEVPVKTATSKIKTELSIDYLYDITIDDFIVIMGSLTDVDDNIITDVPVKVDVSGEKYDVKTDEDGDYIIEYVPDSPGLKTVTVNFAGNGVYEASSVRDTFRVNGQASTYLDLNGIKDTSQGNKVKISGNYTYGNYVPFKSTTVYININGKNYTAKTDNNGYFSYDYTTSKTGTNTVTVSNPGNSSFKGTSKTITFNVKSVGPQYTYVKLNSIQDVAYGASTVISGYYYYGDNVPLTYTNMRVNINGVQVLSKTDAKGFFTYTYKTNRVGKNNVNVSYPGNNNFQQASATKTFNVKITSPIATYIKLNGIKEVNNGQTTAISGYYYYSNDIPLTSTTMRINVNGQTFTAKTDNNGYFTYNYKTNKDGSNKVTVSYPGNNNFKNATATKTFNVKSVGPQYTYVVLNNMNEISYGSSTRVSGYYYYANNIPLTYTTMTITSNGNRVGTTKTDDKGYFTYTYTPERVFKNTVTVSYHGNTNFREASASKSFNVKITSPVSTYIDLLEINDVEQYDYTIISGYYRYGKGIGLSQTRMTINVNGNKYKVTTDNDGYFFYDFGTSKLGKNNVTVSYQGNTNFKAASATKSFMVYNLELYTYELKKSTPDTRITIGNDIFSSWYQTASTPRNKGVYVEINQVNAKNSTTPAENLLIGAKFIFQNSAGKVYSDYFTSGNGSTIYHSLASGYTPLKVLIAYRPMTSSEKQLWITGNLYNPSTGKWYKK